MEDLLWNKQKMDAALMLFSLLEALEGDSTDDKLPAATEPFRMDLLPDTLVPHILSYLTDANDVALASCVSKKWKDFLSFKHRLHFSRTLLDKLDSPLSHDEIVGKMVTSMVQLEELLVHWPFTTSSLALWLAATGNSLRELSLLINNFNEEDTMGKLDCIQSASNLETLKLWYFIMDKTPKWDIFPNLRKLEMVQANITGPALSDALKACPNLTSLKCAFGGEEKVSLSIDLKHLEKCRLDFYESGDNSISLACPKLTTLQLQGYSRIRICETQCLQDLCISNSSGRVYMLDLGKLEALESLDLQGVIWCWDALTKMFQLAREVKRLSVNIVFTGDLNKPVSFHEIDLVEFFNCHPKLQRFNMSGAMFTALCQKNSLKNVDSIFSIPCLEKVNVTVGAHLTAEQALNTLESLVKYSSNLKKMAVKVVKPMKVPRSAFDKLFKAVCKFEEKNSEIVSVASGGN